MLQADFRDGRGSAGRRQGVAARDSRIADLDPGFRLADAYPSQEVTVADLFAHRSGLPGTAGDELETLGYGRNDILHRLRLVKPASSFRAGYAYSNFGLTEGAVAAARAIGKPWEEVEEERLFKPLGMASTSGRYRDFLAHPNRAEDRAGRGRLDGPRQTRSGCAIAGRRNQLSSREISRNGCGWCWRTARSTVSRSFAADSAGAEPPAGDGARAGSGPENAGFLRIGLGHWVSQLWRGMDACRGVQ